MEKQTKCKLVLLRHGESEGNRDHCFCGIRDDALTTNGEAQALNAGKALIGINFGIAFTSKLRRAKNTLEIILNTIESTIPIISLEGLNERNYGILQGMARKDAIEKFGRDNVELWKTSYSIGPKNGENLTDIYNRVRNTFKINILPELTIHDNVIVVCHNGSLRALMRHIENLDPSYINKISIENGMPIIYEFDHIKNTFTRLGEIPKVM